MKKRKEKKRINSVPKWITNNVKIASGSYKLYVRLKIYSSLTKIERVFKEIN